MSETPDTAAIRHASKTSDRRSAPLCGVVVGRTTAPKESVNCPECRVILNHVRNNYPAHAVYTDWRLTPAQARKAVDRMVADMYGGTDD